MSRTIVLVDHGSRVAAANAATEALADDLSARSGATVLGTHMELAEPNYARTLERLAADPAVDEVVVLPLFFSRGKHWREDIEAPVRALNEARPTTRVRILDPLVDDAGFADFLLARLDA